VNERVESRDELLTLLSEACELEHGLACCYIYAAVSLKQDLAEGGLTWEQLQKTRLWASQVFQVAAEEMLHLSQAWNLITALGGTPWYARPNFPQPSTYYPMHLPLETRPFGLDTLERFIAFEHPHDPTTPPPRPRPGDDAPAFRTVGELYATVADAIQRLDTPHLFIGDPDHQITGEVVDFPDLVAVTDTESALRAIDTITEQGEGTQVAPVPDPVLTVARKDSHYEIFLAVRRSYLAQSLKATGTGEVFSPVRPCITNPVAHPSAYLAAAGANPILNRHTAEVADAFDSVYTYMLRLLQYVFDGATPASDETVRDFARAALRVMATVVKPLGEALTLMPAGTRGTRGYGDATAGPTFAVKRHIAFPREPSIAAPVAAETLERLQRRLDQLASTVPKPPQHLGRAAAHLAAIKLSCQPVNAG